MTREEMLRQSGLTEKEFEDLVAKVTKLFKSLDHRQRRALERSLPTALEVARSFGPDLTVEELGDLLGCELQGDTFVSERQIGIWGDAQ